tara:strand:- start:18504 stop:18728 length:225 start_codon:yes stop_codon:yes gene_type:complete
MPCIGPSPRRTITSEDISDLQLWAGQPPGPLLQPSPHGVILQLSPESPDLYLGVLDLGRVQLVEVIEEAAEIVM